MQERGRIIDGKALASAERESIARRVARLDAAGAPCRLDAVLIESGDNAARLYADRQAETCRSLGIGYELHLLPADAGADDIASRIDSLNDAPGVHAVMLHMPLPDAVDAFAMKRRIDPAKDVEGVNPLNIGSIVYGHSSIAPCTALSVIHLIDATGTTLPGARAVVVGAGDVVGKPIAVLLMRREATVISCNVHTRGVADLARSADVLVAAAGVPGLVRADWVMPGAVVIDVGVNRVADGSGGMKTVGDVAYDEVRPLASWISPVPGGVGPMTVAVLLSNVVAAAERAAGLGRPGV